MIEEVFDLKPNKGERDLSGVCGQRGKRGDAQEYYRDPLDIKFIHISGQILEGRRIIMILSSSSVSNFLSMVG